MNKPEPINPLEHSALNDVKRHCDRLGLQARHEACLLQNKALAYETICQRLDSIKSWEELEEVSRVIYKAPATEGWQKARQRIFEELEVIFGLQVGYKTEE